MTAPRGETSQQARRTAPLAGGQFTDARRAGPHQPGSAGQTKPMPRVGSRGVRDCTAAAPISLSLGIAGTPAADRLMRRAPGSALPGQATGTWYFRIRQPHPPLQHDDRTPPQTRFGYRRPWPAFARLIPAACCRPSPAPSGCTVRSCAAVTPPPPLRHAPGNHSTKSSIHGGPSAGPLRFAGSSLKPDGLFRRCSHTGR